MDKFIEEFNVFFEGLATLEAQEQVLVIRIGPRTLEVLLPRVTGGRIKG